MCGRYVLTDTDRLQRRFAVAQLPLDLAPQYNIAPGQTQPVVVAGEAGNAVALMRWGLIPAWAKDPKIGYRTINARAEGLADKPSFRTPLRRQRCLVPASGFYEWRKGGATKTPYYIRPKSGELLGFAGLWDRWHDPSGQEIHTYTIVTTAPNELVAPIHNRMPVILPRDAEEAWLDPENHDPGFLTSLLRPYPAEELAAYPVSPAVNAVANTGEELIAPLSGAF
jgi:putative SOS response-associated peptidase YedK